MTAIAKHDLDIVRGNSPTFLFRWLDSDRNPIDLTGSEIVMGIKWRDGNLQKSTADGDSGLTVDAPNGEVTWTLTPAESRSLPSGRSARFEIERRVSGGEQRSYVTGYLTAVGGLVDDD